MIRRFNRYEFKYILRHKQHLTLVKELENHLRRDPNAGEHGMYRISSLYYDSRDLSCYRNKIDGIKYRRKLRLRVYKDSDMSRGFVEIKQRINRTVQKRRLCLPMDEARSLCRGEAIGLERLRPEDRETALEVLFLVKAQAMRPACVISYHRLAFEGSRYDFGLRVTFDTHLKHRLHALDVSTPCKDRFFLPPDVVVMEVKANEKVPIWLTSVLGAHQCDLKRVSKYCLGVQQGLTAWKGSRVHYRFADHSIRRGKK